MPAKALCPGAPPGNPNPAAQCREMASGVGSTALGSRGSLVPTSGELQRAGPGLQATGLCWDTAHLHLRVPCGSHQSAVPPASHAASKLSLVTTGYTTLTPALAPPISRHSLPL